MHPRCNNMHRPQLVTQNTQQNDLEVISAGKGSRAASNIPQCQELCQLMSAPQAPRWRSPGACGGALSGNKVMPAPALQHRLVSCSATLCTCTAAGAACRGPAHAAQQRPHAQCVLGMQDDTPALLDKEMRFGALKLQSICRYALSSCFGKAQAVRRLCILSVVVLQYRAGKKHTWGVAIPGQHTSQCKGYRQHQDPGGWLRRFWAVLQRTYSRRHAAALENSTACAMRHIGSRRARREPTLRYPGPQDRDNRQLLEYVVPLMAAPNAPALSSTRHHS